jgi:putative IMPACT (imprinted ancient) family translation regulator
VPVDDRAGAEAFFAAEGRAHRNPTHVVPAFRLRDGVSFSSDAGEPAGSAGAPVLAVLAGADLHDVAAVVVRWYGGTNLGVGGLVRAYGGALAAALDTAAVVRCERAADVRLRHAHELTAPVMRCLSLHGARELEHAMALPAQSCASACRSGATRRSSVACATGRAASCRSYAQATP